MAYDTTLLETLPTEQRPAELPACLTRDRLNTGYFAQFTAAQLGLVIALSVVFFWTSIHRLNHTDLWGHLNFGRWMVQHQSLPAVDPFSAAATPAAFSPNCWLAQVSGYLLHETMGLEGLALAHAVLMTIACGAMIAAIRARGVRLSWAIAGGLAYYLLSLPIFSTIRPQLFGMVGAPLVLLACAQLSERKLPLVWLPVLFALWANLHGSFVMGLVMLGACAVGNTWSIFGEKRSLIATLSDARCVRFWAAVGLAVLGATINPLGPQLFVDVLGFGKHAALASISEWRSLSILSLSGGLFFVSAALAVVALKLTKRRWELTDLLLLVVFSLATLSAMRMLVWWAAIWPWAVLPYALSAWEARRGEAAEESPPQAMRALIAVGFVFMAILMSPPTNHLLVGQPRGIGVVGSPDTPIYVADEIERRQLQGAFFAPMDWSDYIVWKQPNGFRPLAWSHVHLLAPEAWTDYQYISAGAPDWLARADAHGVRYLVISKQRQRQLAGSAMKYANRKDTRATILYQDQKSLLVELRGA